MFYLQNRGRVRERALVSPGFDAEDKNHKIDHKQQNNRNFQDQHPPVGLVVIEQLVQIIQGLQLVVDSAMPVGEMKSSRNILVDPGKVPVAKELSDVGELIAKASQVDTDFAEFAQDGAAPTHGSGAQITIGSFEGDIQEPVVCLQFSQLKVGQ